MTSRTPPAVGPAVPVPTALPAEPREASVRPGTVATTGSAQRSSSFRATTGPSPYRVAIVGGGPRGLWALQELSQSLADSPSLGPVAVTLFEPHPTPGAGWIYAPVQPSTLRMNLANRHIDCAGGEGRSFVEWLAESDAASTLALSSEDRATDGFAPRATVGRYLGACFRKTVASLPPTVSLRVERARVTRCARRGSSWSLKSDRRWLRFDDVLLTIGHAGSGPAAGPPADVAGIFPVCERLSEERVAPGSDVAIRGFALTGIDAVLSLTEGRGGRFERVGQTPTNPGRLLYHASGREPRTIRPFSRTGQPMAVKPSACVNNAAGANLIWARGLDTLREAPPSVAVIEALVIDAAAARYKLDRGPQRMMTDGLWQRLLRRSRTPAIRVSVADDWRASLREARRQDSIGEDQALGAAWRMLYPAIVEAVSYGGLPEAEVARFRRMATRFERFAFGPPQPSVERLLALIEAGLVVFDNAAGPSVERSGDGWQVGDAHVQTLVDARVAAAGVRDLPPDGLLADLIMRGLIDVDDNWDAIVSQPDGSVADHLAVIGRVAEGNVLGHDTLTRTMHDQIPRWAASVADRVASQQTASVPLAAVAR